MCLLNRPDKQDKADKEPLTQTHSEQVSANVRFRTLAEFFASTTYLHLVPQLLKFADRIGGNRLEDIQTWTKSTVHRKGPGSSDTLDLSWNAVTLSTR